MTFLLCWIPLLPFGGIVSGVILHYTIPSRQKVCSAARAPSLDFQQHSHRCCSPADSYAHIQVGSGRHISPKQNSKESRIGAHVLTSWIIAFSQPVSNPSFECPCNVALCLLSIAFLFQVFQNPSFPCPRRQKGLVIQCPGKDLLLRHQSFWPHRR